MSARLLLAAEFAARVHHGHVRKYTNEPYFVHLASVARILAQAGCGEDLQIAGLLHDAVEDHPTKCSFDDVERMFGARVRNLCVMATKVSYPEMGNREKRKAADNAHFSAADADGQTLKYADLIDNTRTIVYYDPDFAKVYMAEKRELLQTMTRGNGALYFEATRMVEEYFKIQESRSGVQASS